MQSVDDWNPDDGLTASHLQQAVRALREIDNEQGYQPGERQWRMLESFPATITNTGPSGEPDGTREVYWVQKAFFKGGDIADPLMLDVDQLYSDGSTSDANIEPTIYPATNLTEWVGGTVAGTHSLRTDITCAVWVSAWYDRGDPQQKRYFFTAPPPPGPQWGTLTQDGGSNGSSSGGVLTNPSFTYTLKSLRGTTLGTGLSPIFARPGGILTGPATQGLYIVAPYPLVSPATPTPTPTGTVLLLMTDEQAALDPCG